MEQNADWIRCTDQIMGTEVGGLGGMESGGLRAVRLKGMLTVENIQLLNSKWIFTTWQTQNNGNKEGNKCMTPDNSQSTRSGRPRRRCRAHRNISGMTVYSSPSFLKFHNVPLRQQSFRTMGQIFYFELFKYLKSLSHCKDISIYILNSVLPVTSF